MLQLRLPITSSFSLSLKMVDVLGQNIASIATEHDTQYGPNQTQCSTIDIEKGGDHDHVEVETKDRKSVV